MADARRNWRAVGITVLVVVAVAVAAAILARVLLDRSESTPGSGGGQSSEDAQAASVLAEDLPTLEDLTSEVTLPPGPSTGLQVVESGVTIVEDRFDSTKREGSYAVVLANDHETWLAQGVDVDVTFLGPGGEPLGTDSGFVPVILPTQRVAVASLIFNAPADAVAGLQVDVGVARWREVAPVEGQLSVTSFETTDDDLAGVRTTFELVSTLESPLSDVGVTAVYRDASGAILGGFDTFLEFVEPNKPVEGAITLLVNIDTERVAATELYPTVGFGFGDDD